MASAGNETTLLQHLRDDLRRGAQDPVVVAQDALGRANSNPGRNTYLWADASWTIQLAEALARILSDPHARPPFYGLPISLKDCFDLAGTVTTCGTHFYARHNQRAAHNSTIASRLLAGGAVITGKTHLHPLAYGITGENPDYGDCLQPGQPDRLTGGSSSGAAASVLEGSAVAAIGTDTGGSIRVPAALCGLAGYRSSFNVSRDLWQGGAHLAPSFDTIGWLYRDLEDGPWLGRALFDLSNHGNHWSNPHVACVGAEFLADCEPRVLQGYEVTKQEIASLGARLSRVDVSFWDQSMEIFGAIQAHEAARLHAGHFAEFEPAIRDRLTWGASISNRELLELRQRCGAFRTRMAAMLSPFDLLVLPASPVAKLSAGADHSQTRQKLLRYTTPISLAGWPAVTIPASVGIDAGGVQAVAAQGQDEALLEWSARIGRARRQSAEIH
jgi:Asp-tRNA(Asn)/Glu-tRNA(Gln) amidotransferase A subunit family amidase